MIDGWFIEWLAQDPLSLLLLQHFEVSVLCCVRALPKRNILTLCIFIFLSLRMLIFLKSYFIKHNSRRKEVDGENITICLFSK